MNIFVFCLYYVPIILSIISLFGCKIVYCEHEWKDRYSNSDDIIEKPVKMYGWLYMLLIMFAFIPIINMAEFICLWCVFGSEYYVKESVKKWFSNLWIIKILSKQY